MIENQQSANATEEQFRNDASEATPSAVQQVVVQRTTQAELEKQHHGVIQTWALSVLATAAVLTLGYYAKPVLIVVLVSELISFALAPIVDFCERFIRLPKTVSSMIAVLQLVGARY